MKKTSVAGMVVMMLQFQPMAGEQDKASGRYLKRDNPDVETRFSLCSESLVASPFGDEFPYVFRLGEPIRVTLRLLNMEKDADVPLRSGGRRWYDELALSISVAEQDSDPKREAIPIMLAFAKEIPRRTAHTDEVLGQIGPVRDIGFQFALGRCVPDSRAAVGAGERNEPVSAGHEGEVMHGAIVPSQRQQQIAGLHIPDADRAVLPAGNESLAPWRKRSAVHTPRVSCQVVKRFALAIVQPNALGRIASRRLFEKNCRRPSSIR